MNINFNHPFNSPYSTPELKSDDLFDLDIEIKEEAVLESSELTSTGMCKTATAACTRHRCRGNAND